MMGARDHVWRGGSLMYVNGRDIRNSWGNAVRGRGRSRGLGSGDGETRGKIVMWSDPEGSPRFTSQNINRETRFSHAGDSRGDAVWGRGRRRRGVGRRARNSGGGGVHEINAGKTRVRGLDIRIALKAWIR